MNSIVSRYFHFAAALAALLASAARAPAHHIHTLWTATIPSASGYSWDVAVDLDGNAFVAGFDLPTLTDSNDGFIRKYDPQGNVVWTTRIGALLEYDPAFAIDLDPHGNVLIAGITWGNFGGGTIANQDVLVAKYDPLGSLIWARQYDSPGDPEGGQAIAVDSAGASYVAGYGTSGITKWDADGIFQWHATLTPTNFAWTSGDDVTIDSAGNILVTGYINSQYAPVRDVLVAKFSPAGQRLWSTQIPGTLIEESLGVAVDAENNVYLATAASADFYESDSVVIKLDAAGNVVWKTNLGQTTDDFAVSLAVHCDELLVTGMVRRDSGLPQPYLAEFSLDGQLTHLETLDSVSMPFSLAVQGNSAWLAGQNFENSAQINNAWLVRVAIPEPSGAVLAATCVMAIAATRRQTMRRPRQTSSRRVWR